MVTSAGACTSRRPYDASCFLSPAAPGVPAGKVVAQPDDAAKSFIRVSGNVFVDDACREFLYTGWNG